jgi:hypothetical protein
LQHPGRSVFERMSTHGGLPDAATQPGSRRGDFPCFGQCKLREGELLPAPGPSTKRSSRPTCPVLSRPHGGC